MIVRRRRDVEIKRPEVQYEPLTVHSSTECHVTPMMSATFMVDCLDISPGMSVLEPEAGTGNLIKALIDHGIQPMQITAVERSYDLANVIEASFAGIEFYHECFLQYAGDTDRKYDRVIMNPPFRKAKLHITAALSMLSCDGIMVAIVPVTFEHDDAELIDTLPEDTFANAKVRTKIVKFEHG